VKSADDLLAAFQTWRDGTRYTHEHYEPRLGQYVGHVPVHKFRDAERVLLEMLPALIDGARSRCSDSTPAREAAS